MKSYIISVSLYKGCYRHIRISAGATLYKLHKAILNAFNFEDDHAMPSLWTTIIGAAMPLSFL